MIISKQEVLIINSEGRGYPSQDRGERRPGKYPRSPHTLVYCGRSQVLGVRVTAIVRVGVLNDSELGKVLVDLPLVNRCSKRVPFCECNFSQTINNMWPKCITDEFILHQGSMSSNQ